MNQGIFTDDTYKKYVSFSKAVLWKDRAISLPPHITRQFKTRGIKWIVFEDIKKNERWTLDYDTAKDNAELKKVGQEAQFYIPIDIFKVSQIKSDTDKQFADDVAWFDKL